MLPHGSSAHADAPWSTRGSSAAGGGHTSVTFRQLWADATWFAVLNVLPANGTSKYPARIAMQTTRRPMQSARLRTVRTRRGSAIRRANASVRLHRNRAVSPVQPRRRVKKTPVRSRFAQPPACPTKLSVVMPVYNERDTVATAIERVLETKIDNVTIELIIIDSASTDGSR